MKLLLILAVMCLASGNVAPAPTASANPECGAIPSPALCVASPACQWCGNVSAPSAGTCFNVSDHGVQCCAPGTPDAPAYCCNPGGCFNSAAQVCRPNATTGVPEVCMLVVEDAPDYNCSTAFCCPSGQTKVCGGRACIPDGDVCCGGSRVAAAPASGFVSCPSNSACCWDECCDAAKGQTCNTTSRTCVPMTSACPALLTSTDCAQQSASDGCAWCGAVGDVSPLGFCFSPAADNVTCCATNGTCQSLPPVLCSTSAPICVFNPAYYCEAHCCPEDLPIVCGPGCMSKNSTCCDGRACQDPDTCCYSGCCAPDSVCCTGSEGSSWCCPNPQVCDHSRFCV